jgi:hypothetical protein
MAALNNFAQLLAARTEELTDLGKEEFLRFGNHRSLVTLFLKTSYTHTS